jgi:integrase
VRDEDDPGSQGHDEKQTLPSDAEQGDTRNPDEIVSRAEQALKYLRRRNGVSTEKDRAPVDANSCSTECSQDASRALVVSTPITVVPTRVAKVVADMMGKALKQTPSILEACAAAVQVTESTQDRTIRDYEAKYRRLTHKLGDPGIHPNVDEWLMSLAPYHGAENSFKAYRAALAHGLRQRIRDMLALQADLHLSYGHTPDWLDVVTRLNAHLSILNAVKKAAHGADFWQSLGGEKRIGTRKAVDLRKLVKLYPNWRAGFLSAMSRTKYEDPAHVSDLIGCRPDELRKGAIIRRVDVNNFSITIHGGKVGKQSGQEWRTVTFAMRVLPSCWVDRLERDGEIHVHIKSVAAYRQSEKRVSDRLFSKAPNITPYTFRHAFRTKQAEEGASEAETGAAMGHSSAESQFAYGSPPAKGKKRIKPSERAISDVKSARPVKPRDKASLQALLEKKRVKPKA